MRGPSRFLPAGALLLLSLGLVPAAEGRTLPAKAPFCVAGAMMTPAAWQRTAADAPAPGPQARPTLHVQGTLPHTGIHDASSSAERDFGYMLDLALDWRFTGDRSALARLAAYFDAWTQTYRPSFDPIDETDFDGLIEAYGLTKTVLPQQTAFGARDLVRALGEGYLVRMERSRYPLPANNWQSHRIKLATLAAVALDDDAMLERARALFESQLAANMAADGEVRDFRDRDALHYVTYDLEPLVRAALAARERGEDWLRIAGPSGQTLTAGLDWLMPYATGALQHQEFVHSTVPFDGERARAGMRGFSGLWDRRTAAPLYWSAASLDRRYLGLADALSVEPPRWLFAYAGPCGGRSAGKVALAGSRR